MPIIRATQRGYTGQSRTVFLTIEDFQFVSPDSSMLEVEEFSEEIDELPLVKAKRLEIASLQRHVEAEQLEIASFERRMEDDLQRMRRQKNNFLLTQRYHVFLAKQVQEADRHIKVKQLELSQARYELQQVMSAIAKQLEIASLQRGLEAKQLEIASLERNLEAKQLEIASLERGTEDNKQFNAASSEHMRRQKSKQKHQQPMQRYHALVEQCQRVDKHLKVKQLELSRARAELQQAMIAKAKQEISCDESVVESPQVEKVIHELSERLQQAMSVTTTFVPREGVVDAPVLGPNRLSKKDWIEMSRKVWDLRGDDFIRSRLKSEKSELSIYICGSFGKGYGAILRDSQATPVVGSSRPLSVEDGVSTFYTRLHGVALGVTIALKYELTDFYFYVPSFNLYNVLTSIWGPCGSEDYFVSRNDLRSMLRPEDKVDIEKIYRLATSIVSDLHKLRVHDISFFKWQPVLSIHNKAAEFLANRSFDQDMNFQEICGNDILCEILYQDAVR